MKIIYRRKTKFFQKTWFLFIIVPVFFLAALPLSICADEIIPPERQSELLHLLRHDCGACHGMTLKGGLGPPLLPKTLAVFPFEAKVFAEQKLLPRKAFLLHTILEGRAGTAMPPWRDFLTQAEAEWLLEQLLRGIDDETP